MNDIISIPEDFSSYTAESSNEIDLHDKSCCTDLSIVHYIFSNRTNNENVFFFNKIIKR